MLRVWLHSCVVVASAFLLAAAILTAVGIKNAHSTHYLLFYPAVSFFLVGIAYAFPRRIGPRVLGKRSNGSLPVQAWILLAPFLLYTHIVWHVGRLFGGRVAHNRISPGIYLGRRPFHSELPPDVKTVIDLTAEFVPARHVRRQREYLTLPTLDFCPPEALGLVALVGQVAPLAGPFYIHCAAGKGRSALFVAALLIARGEAKDFEEAERLIRAARPSIRLSQGQRAIFPELLPPLLRLASDISKNRPASVGASEQR